MFPMQGWGSLVESIRQHSPGGELFEVGGGRRAETVLRRVKVLNVMFQSVCGEDYRNFLACSGLYVLCLVVWVGFCLETLVLTNCRLSHIVWKKRGHGLTSRPRETSSVIFLNELLVFSLVTLPGLGLRFWREPCQFRYGAVKFDCKVPTWKLPTAGNVAGLVTEGGEEVGSVHVAGVSVGGSGLSGRRFKRVRLSRKTLASLVFQGVLRGQPRPRVWTVFLHLEQMMMLGGGSCMIICKMGHLCMTGWELPERHCGKHRPTSPGLHAF